MTAATLQKFDFRRSGFIDPAISRMLRIWMGKAAQVFAGRWEEMAPTAIPVHAGSPFTQTFGTLIDNLGEISTGSVLAVGNEKFPSLLTVGRAGLLALIGQVLCNNPEQMPEPRELTSIENELAHLLFEAFVAACSEAWPQKEPLKVSCGNIEQEPQKWRLYGADDFMIAIPVEIDSAAGRVVLEWSLPRQKLVDMLAPLVDSKPVAKPATVNPLQTVMEIPVDVTVLLGSANLGMTELCQLAVGDVIVLDQRIDDPLAAMIGHDRIYAGWPGRVGPCQALKITDRF